MAVRCRSVSGSDGTFASTREQGHPDSCRVKRSGATTGRRHHDPGADSRHAARREGPRHACVRLDRIPSGPRPSGFVPGNRKSRGYGSGARRRIGAPRSTCQNDSPSSRAIGRVQMVTPAGGCVVPVRDVLAGRG